MSAQLASATGLKKAPQHEMYVLRAIGSPPCISAMVIAVGVGLWQLGIAGTVLLLVSTIVIAAYASACSFVRRGLDRAAAERARSKRESARFAQLRTASEPRQEQYAEVRKLVERAARCDAAVAERLELQTLLDEFVRIAVKHQRCLDALRPAYMPPGGEALLSARRRELVARRLRCRDECERHAERLAQELDDLEELVRFVDQKLACPPDEAEGDAQIERRLWELDEVDTALRQLSA